MTVKISASLEESQVLNQEQLNKKKEDLDAYTHLTSADICTCSEHTEG